MQEEYLEARRRGQKDYRRCVSAGVYPYLPALEDFLPDAGKLQERDLGIIQIPADFIVGTFTHTRNNAFARNFMPLLDVDTEFASKWQHLCQAHLQEGIRDAVRVYEYMNRYYVVEGNKRVSVLKYFGAVNIAGQVIRIMPREEDGANLQLYLELLRFQRASGISFAEFSRPGSFLRLQSLVGKQPDEEWTQEERAAFTALFYRFKSVFAPYHEGPRRTVADALLSLMEIYGYESLRKLSNTELKKRLESVREEVDLLEAEEPVQLQLDPGEEKKTGLLERVLPADNRPLKVAFIHDKNPETSGWTLSHELGRLQTQDYFGGSVETFSVFDAMEKDPERILEDAVKAGCRVLFTTSPRLQSAALRCAVAHPEVTVFNCSLNTSHRYIRTYYARMYEAKFVMGAIAGSLAGSNPVGYICDYPVFGHVACINAFAQGMQMVNPRCRMVLEWSCLDGLSAARERLHQKGILLVSNPDMTGVQDFGHGSFGLSVHGEDSDVYLARPVWEWGRYYQDLLRRYRARSLQQEYTKTDSALNYFWGMSAGVVQVQCAPTVMESTRRLAELMTSSLCAGLFTPFNGVMYDQNGVRHGEEGRSLGLKETVSMDWLLENVDGSIPAYEELNEAGRSIVERMGVGLVREGAAPSAAAQKTE